jgi:hypothetical protein
MIEEKSNSAIVLPKRGNQNSPSPLPSPARGEGNTVCFSAEVPYYGSAKVKKLRKT